MYKNKIIEFKKLESKEKSIVKNNNAEVVGYLVAEPKPNHKNLDTQYYIAYLKSPFDSKFGEKENVVPVLLTENDLKELDLQVGEIYLARGRWSSVKHEDGTFSEFLFTKKIMPIDKESVKFRNHIVLDGYIRKTPFRKSTFNKYKQRFEKQAETLISIPRPAGKTAEGEDKIKTDTVGIAFRGNFIDAADHLKHGDRISIKGFIEEVKDKDDNLIKYIVIATDVVVLVEVEPKPVLTDLEAPTIEE